MVTISHETNGVSDKEETEISLKTTYRKKRNSFVAATMLFPCYKMISVERGDLKR